MVASEDRQTAPARAAIVPAMTDADVRDFVTRFADVVIAEWQCTRQIGGRRLDWRGVDKFRLRDGRIIEERVYMDTAILRAVREGKAPEPLMRL